MKAIFFSIKHSMTNFSLLLLIAIFIIQFTTSVQKVEASSTTTITFDNTSDLTDNFNPDSTPVFSNISNSGLGNTGSVNVPLASDDIWVTKQSYTVTGEGDKYIISAYFKVRDNLGYAGLGFTNATSSETDSYGSPLKGIGVMFQNGSGYFVSNRAVTSINWTPDLVIGNWYKMVLEATAGSDRNNYYYDLILQIWNSDSNGVLGSLKTEQLLNAVPNDDLGISNILHGYISVVGSIMEKIDHFQVNLSGGPTFVAEGSPVVITGDTGSVSIYEVEVSGNVKDDQGHAVTARGVCWGTNSLPSLTGTCTSNGSGTGVFTAILSNLLPSTIYHYRAYATNAIGTSYGDDKTFITLSPEIPPTVTTNSADNISRSSARLNGNITDIGTDNANSRGFEYGASTSYGLEIHTNGNYSTGSYSLVLSNLSCATGYHFRAFATNNVDTSYGEDKTFTTSKCLSSSGGGSTVENRVANLIRMGKISEAEELVKRYPGKFPSYISLLNNGRSLNATVNTPSSTSTLPVRDLYFNMSGNDVKRLQEILIINDSGVYANRLKIAGATGYFGNYTRNALSEYQKIHNIFPTLGYFGQVTRKQMKDNSVLGVWW